MSMFWTDHDAPGCVPEALITRKVPRMGRDHLYPMQIPPNAWGKNSRTRSMEGLTNASDCANEIANGCGLLAN